VTIAVCYMSPEGVVFGADSTSSAVVSPGGFHYFNHNQKLFELGVDSTLAVLTWGLGGLGPVSHRSLIASLSDDLRNTPPAGVAEVAHRWADRFWPAYSTSPVLSQQFGLCRALAAKPPFDPSSGAQPAGRRTKAEEAKFQELRRQLVVGFCVGGYVLPDRTPCAYEIIFDPLKNRPMPSEIPQCTQRWWGAPNVIQRLLFGVDDGLRKRILSSGKWNGTAAELEQIVDQQKWLHPILPIRDAIDFVHACIFSTIKAMKFSNFSQICGGPIEIGVITSDRPFRWVRHKDWDVAITEGIP
jgi:hypothetical protein